MPQPDAAAYQAALAEFVRNPEQAAPPGICPERAAVYTRLTRNNVRSFVRRCFTAARPLADAEVWADLENRFLAEAAPASPYFSDIPALFVEYARTDGRLPAPLLELMDFETVQLAAETAPLFDHAPSSWRHDTPLGFSPAAFIRRYPVDFISSGLQGFADQAAEVLVWRNRQDAVMHRLLDAQLLPLLEHFAGQADSLNGLLQALAEVLPDAETLRPWLAEQVDVWVRQGVLLPKEAA